MLQPMLTPLGNLLEFLPAVDLGAAPTLRMLMLKVKFWVLSGTFGCSAKGFQAMSEGGLAKVLADAIEGDGSSVELWLRTMVHEVWMGYLKVPALVLAEVHDQLETLAKDAEKGCEVFLNCDQSSAVDTGVVAPVLADLQALAVMALAWKPDCVLADDVSQALDRLKEKRMGCIASLLPKCDLGREMLASSALIIQKSCQTATADAHFARAQTLLSDDRFPHIKEVADLLVLVNRHMVADLSVFEVLGEALDLIDQAIEQWSRMDMSQNAEAVVMCIAEMMGHLLIVEECFALDIELLLRESGLNEVVLDVASKTNDWDAEAAAGAFQAAVDFSRVYRLLGSTCRCSSRSECFSGCASSLVTFSVSKRWIPRSRMRLSLCCEASSLEHSSWGCIAS